MESSPTSLSEQLYQLEKLLLQPDVRQSSEQLSILLADDFFEFSSSGKVWYKNEIGPEGITVRDMEIFDFSLHPLKEDIALVTYRIVDCTRQQHSLRSSIWKRKNGMWQMSFHQGTLTQYEKKGPSKK